MQLSVFFAAGKAEGDRLPQLVQNDEWPTVDIFITYCGEGDHIVLNTAKAACAVDYPQALLRVIVLDDSHSANLAAMVDQLGKECPNLSYASRNVRVKTHSKASNLNFGLQHVESLRLGRSDYVAVLDVDMIPEPQWLRQVLPPLLNNPRAALAGPSQRYYNLPPGDPLDVNSEFQAFECIMHLQDFSNNSCCMGSGFAARRSALECIGGFPEESMQEDILTSYFLSAAGLHSIFVPGSLQWGMGPDTIPGYLKQCQRWMVGIISVGQFVCSDRAKWLPPQTRFTGVLCALIVGSASFIWTFALVALPTLALTGQTLIPLGTTTHLRVLIRLASLDFAAQSLYNIFRSSILDFRMPIHGLVAPVWTQPWRASIALRYFIIPKLFGNHVPNFSPTGISTDGEAERAARTRGSRIACSKAVFWDCGAYTHLLVFLVCVAGAGIWAQMALGTFTGEGARSAALLLLTGIAWPHFLLLWAALAKSAWVPVAYAIMPVPVATDGELFVRNPTNGVKYASAKAKNNFMCRPRQWPFLFHCLIYLSATLVSEYL